VRKFYNISYHILSIFHQTLMRNVSSNSVSNFFHFPLSTLFGFYFIWGYCNYVIMWPFFSFDYQIWDLEQHPLFSKLQYIMALFWVCSLHPWSISLKIFYLISCCQEILITGASILVQEFRSKISKISWYFLHYLKISSFSQAFVCKRKGKGPKEIWLEL
jgi:hypothetical protein